MKHFLMQAALAVAVAAVVTPAQAQFPQIAAQPPQAAYPGVVYQPYPLMAPTPDDAYRDGLIDRWELERLQGPLPQALLGPPVNGNRGSDGGGGRD